VPLALIYWGGQTRQNKEMQGEAAENQTRTAEEILIGTSLITPEPHVLWGYRDKDPTIEANLSRA